MKSDIGNRGGLVTGLNGGRVYEDIGWSRDIYAVGVWTFHRCSDVNMGDF